jgi:diaminopropionate ammonia-lyase
MVKKEDIEYIVNENSRMEIDKKAPLEFIDKDTVKKVRTFHKSFPQYTRTPLAKQNNLAGHLGVSRVWVKDESYRFGLNAFKVLGGSYAVGKYLAGRLNMDISELSFEKLKSEEIREKLGVITFVTATDGNHGRGIAWAANQLGHKSVVFMPKGSSEIRLENIRKEGAEASITELNYDDAVRLADKYAKEHGGVMIQDSAWEGYTEIPTWIMQGYATIMDEALEQIKEAGEDKPTHVFLQAGVGSFAGSMLGCLLSEYGDEWPVTTIVEPDKAACIYKSAKAKDGKPHAVTGFMPTIMAGLACGEPSIVSWGLLRDYSDMYISCADYFTAKGMRVLGNPLGDDAKVVSGESGAVGLGVLTMVMQEESLKDIAGKLKLGKDSRILIISTEGDTDPENYRKIVWDGMYPSV